MVRLTQAEAIQRALSKGFAIKVSGFDAAIASARLTEAMGKFDPVLAGEFSNRGARDPIAIGTSTETDSYDLSVRGLLPWGMTYSLGGSTTNARGTFNLYANNHQSFAGVSATQPLLRDFGFGPTLASIRIARASNAIGEWQFRADAIDTVTNVVLAYQNLQFAQAVRQSALRSRELAASLLAENEKRFRVGSMSEYDVTTARSRLANREEGIIAAERAVKDAENFLKQQVSDDTGPELLAYGFEIDPPDAPPVVVVDAAADFRVALQKRPDYQQARLALDRSAINRRLARNQLLPRVDLVGSYGYAGADSDFGTSRRIVQDRDYRSYSYGVAVSVPLTLTTERGRYRVARLGHQQAEAALARLEQDIVVRVGNAAGQIEAAFQRVGAAKQALGLAQQTLDAELKRLRAGTSNTFFVLQQQEILTSLEVSHFRAVLDYHRALAEYDRQLGVTLEKRNIAIEPPK